MQRRAEIENSLWCGACKRMHPKPAFGRDRNSVSGLAYACKTVVKARNKRAHENNRDANNRRHALHRIRRKASSESKTWAAKKLLSEAARRARNKELDFDLQIDRLHLPERCPIFNVRLIYQADKRRLPNSASLDRIDSRHGYTHDNVWVVSWRANQVKGDATPDELRKVTEAVAGRTLDGITWDQYPV